MTHIQGKTCERPNLLLTSSLPFGLLNNINYRDFHPSSKCPFLPFVFRLISVLTWWNYPLFVLLDCNLLMLNLSWNLKKSHKEFFSSLKENLFSPNLKANPFFHFERKSVSPSWKRIFFPNLKENLFLIWKIFFPIWKKFFFPNWKENLFSNQSSERPN